LIGPYFVHAIPYSLRILLISVLSIIGMLLIVSTPDGGPLGPKMAGIVLASVASGAGELSFLGLTHYYGHFSLAAWGSGTGGAGLVGAAIYVAATSWWGWTVHTTLLASALFPFIMLASFFALLPREPLRAANANRLARYEPVGAGDEEEREVLTSPVDDLDEAEIGSFEYTTTQSTHSSSFALANPKSSSAITSRIKGMVSGVKQNLNRTKSLFIPYMLPLLLVYIAEYTINQGVAPTLLFPLDSTPFKQFRDFYPAYNAIYQSGVFISRSSSPFFRVHTLYVPSLLQCLNLLVLILHALFNFIPSVYIVFIIIFWEGLLGGLVYVNTFHEITDNVRVEDREFSLGATSVSDSGGVCIAGFLSMAVEVGLCGWQVRHGRGYCKER
jgi:battenin